MSNKKKNNNYATDKTAVAKQKEKKAISSKKTKEVVKQVLIITLSVLLIAGAIVGFWFLMKACSKTPDKSFDKPSAGVFKVTHTVNIKVKGYDEPIEIDLYGEEAPETVKFLVEALQSGSYTDKEIYISKYTSDKYVTLTNGDNSVVKGEFYNNGAYTNNNVSHAKGVITMQKAGIAQSARYYFDVLLEDNFALDGTRAAVGFIKSDKGLDFIKKLVDEYRADKETSLEEEEEATIPEIYFGTNSSIKVTADELATENKTIDRTFIPKTTGKYTFKSANFVSIKVLDGETEVVALNATAELSDGIEYDLVAGKEYKVTLGVEGLKADTAYSVIISGEVFQNGDNTVTFAKIESGAQEKATSTEETKVTREKTYKFTASQDAEYTFKSKDGKVTISVIDGSTVLGTAGTEVSVELKAGVTYDIHMTTTEKADSYVISITEKVLFLGDNTVVFPKAEATESTNTNTNSSKAASSSSNTISDSTKTTRELEYKFTADNTATYVFRSKSDKVTITVSENGTAVGKAGTTTAVDLKAGVAYTIKLTTTDTTDSHVITIAEKIINVGNNTVLITSLDKATDVKYSEYMFTADKTGTYKFELTTTSNSAIKNAKKVAIYKGSSYVGEKYAYLIEGEVYTVRVMTEALTSGTSYKVSVTEPVLSLGQTDVIITKNEAGEDSEGKAVAGKNAASYYYTAVADGMHVFKCTNEEFELEIFDGTKKLGVESADLVKGKEYTIKLVGKEIEGTRKNLVQGETYTITVQSPIFLFGSNDIKIVNDDATFTFKPTANGIYSIKETADALKDGGKIELLDKDGNAIEDIDLEYIVLEKGETYQIKVTKPEKADGNYTIVISNLLPIIEGVTVTTK